MNIEHYTPEELFVYTATVIYHKHEKIYEVNEDLIEYYFNNCRLAVDKINSLQSLVVPGVFWVDYNTSTKTLVFHIGDKDLLKTIAVNVLVVENDAFKKAVELRLLIKEIDEQLDS